MPTPYHKFVFLKLFYKCIRGIHHEKLKTPDALEQFRLLLDNNMSKSLTNLMRQLMKDLTELNEQLEIMKNSNLETLEISLGHLFQKLSENAFLDSAKYIFKIYSFYNLISKYNSLGDFNVVVLAWHFHQICKNDLQI